MLNYQQLMYKILTQGEQRGDRTGVGTYSLFGEQLRFDLRRSFPAVTTKRLWFKGVKEELAWMLRGETNVQSLEEKGVNIWSAWANENGDLGPVYGAQWVNWPTLEGSEVRLKGDSLIIEPGGFDQVTYLEEQLMDNPESRRHIISAWNVADLDAMALQPCHVMSQFYVTGDGGLKCHMHQRSCDFFLGGPFNIAQYALLTHALAARTGLTPDELIISYGDVHIYKNHVEQCELQLEREPRPAPSLRFDLPEKDLDFRSLEELVLSAVLVDYDPYPTIKADIAV